MWPRRKRVRLALVELDAVTFSEYQHPPDERLVKKIAEDFDPGLVGLVKVRDNADGKLTVIDGAHRVAAARRVGNTRLLAEIDEPHLPRVRRWLRFFR